jgi:hypothetical protein
VALPLAVPCRHPHLHPRWRHQHRSATRQMIQSTQASFWDDVDTQMAQVEQRMDAEFQDVYRMQQRMDADMDAAFRSASRLQARLDEEMDSALRDARRLEQQIDRDVDRAVRQVQQEQPRLRIEWEEARSPGSYR